MPFGVGPLEILILLLVALLVFGPKRLPEMGRSLGRGMREFKDSIAGKDEPEPEPSQQQAAAQLPPAAATPAPAPTAQPPADEQPAPATTAAPPERDAVP